MIEFVDDTLVALLEREFGSNSVAVVSPDKAGSIPLGLFPYAAVECPDRKNDPHIALTPTSSKRPPLFLDVYYLLTAHLVLTLRDSHALLARAMRVLHEHGTLRGSDLAPGLRAPDRELHVTAIAISVEDLSRLWSVFPGQQYRLSAAFLVTPIPIELKDENEDRRVTDRRDRFGTLVQA